MPIYMYMLYRIRLIIHVSAAPPILDALEAGIRGAVPVSLGRWEDLVRFDECERVKLERAEDEIEMRLPMYVPVSADLDETHGNPYRLNWKYEIRQDVRQWEKIPVRYVPAGDFLAGPDLWADQADIDVYPVVFPPEMGD